MNRTMSAGIAMAPATGRRVICPVCGENVGEVGPASRGRQVAHHELPPWNTTFARPACEGFGMASALLPDAP